MFPTANKITAATEAMKLKSTTAQADTKAIQKIKL